MNHIAMAFNGVLNFGAVIYSQWKLHIPPGKVVQQLHAEYH